MSCQACPDPSSSPPGIESEMECVCDTGFSLETSSTRRRRSASTDAFKLSGPVSTRDHDMGPTSYVSAYTCRACSETDLPPSGCNCNGYYSTSGGGCSPCPANSVSLKGASQATDCKCNQGYYYAVADSSCSPCPENSVPAYDYAGNQWGCNCTSGFYAVGFSSSSSLRSASLLSSEDNFLRDHDYSYMNGGSGASYGSAPTCGTEPAATGILQCDDASHYVLSLEWHAHCIVSMGRA